jgi:hypothetical protein
MSNSPLENEYDQFTILRKQLRYAILERQEIWFKKRYDGKYEDINDLEAVIKYYHQQIAYLNKKAKVKRVPLCRSVPMTNFPIFEESPKEVERAFEEQAQLNNLRKSKTQNYNQYPPTGKKH